MSNNLRSLTVILMILSVSSCVNAARILGYFPSTVKSHLIIHCAIADTLAKAGHDVTVIGSLPNVNKQAKYKYIEIKAEGVDINFSRNIVNNQPSMVEVMFRITKEFPDICHNHMEHPRMQEFLKTHNEYSFDLVILGYIFNDFQFGLAAHFKCPIIVSFTVQPLPMINYVVGNPNELAYVPALAAKMQQPMTFRDRLINFLLNFTSSFILDPFFQYYTNKYYNYHFPSSRYPPLSEMRKNISLLFVNHYQASQGPIRPNVPALIEIGGIQIKEKADPLPKDILAILDRSEEGVIYFSFGTYIQGNELHEDKARIMFNVLSKLPYKVLWKWGDSRLPGESSNIIYKSWLPQDDILAHKNVKLFITHGGQGSVVESQYHGVPMVGLPLFADQPSNLDRVQSSGFGLKLEYSSLTEDSFREAILEVINNSTYRNSVQSFSKLYRDRPMTPQAMVVYWTEYVLRYNGAKHLQSPAVHLNLFQLLCLDVIAFLLAILTVAFISLYKLFKFIFSIKPRFQRIADVDKKIQ